MQSPTQLSLFQQPAAVEHMTPCLVGWVVGFDPKGKWHDPANPRLTQTRLLLAPRHLPELVPPYVDHRRAIRCGEAVAAGPGWADPAAHFVIGRSLVDLIAAAEAAADLFEPDPVFPWVPSTLRAIAEHWRRFEQPDWAVLKHWPGDAHPEVLG
jgi:hypothetical protein